MKYFNFHRLSVPIMKYFLFYSEIIKCFFVFTGSIFRFWTAWMCCWRFLGTTAQSPWLGTLSVTRSSAPSSVPCARCVTIVTKALAVTNESVHREVIFMTGVKVYATEAVAITVGVRSHTLRWLVSELMTMCLFILLEEMHPIPARSTCLSQFESVHSAWSVVSVNVTVYVACVCSNTLIPSSCYHSRLLLCCGLQIGCRVLTREDRDGV